MISLIEALNFRCLRHVRQPMGPFQILVGPNGSGKTTFLEVVSFLGRLVSEGLEAAIEDRTRNFQDLVWARGRGAFELAIEAEIPEGVRARLAASHYGTVRYEISVGPADGSGEIHILEEKGVLKREARGAMRQRTLFPAEGAPPTSILSPAGRKGTQTLFHKVPGGNDNFYSEVRPKQERWAPAFKLGPRKSTLANLPADETNFPVSTWMKAFLTERIQHIALNSAAIRKPSPPGQQRWFKSDGSNLPWVVADLARQSPQGLDPWIRHLRTSLPDLSAIRTVERPEDRHRYLVIEYQDGTQVPSWVASDGTLRLLALTLLAYLPEFEGVCLIEEPENGIHPRAVETLFQSLSSVYRAQIILATHSPVILGLAKPESVLCFAKTPDGATDVVRGDKHPALRDWQGETNLGTLFATGVLGQ